MSTGPKNKLLISWSDSAFFPWLNETTVLDYFCNPTNPFYSVDCNNQTLKMQNVSLEQLTIMIGSEYQLFLSQPPLYIIRKVERQSPTNVTPMSYYYILNGTVYQAPDLMSLLSSRLQTTSHYLEETLETAFSHYRYNPSKGYYWDFEKNEDAKKNEEILEKPSQFHVERVSLLVQEFANKFPPYKYQDPEQQQLTQTDQQQQQQQIVSQSDSNGNDLKNVDQPAEKKMKMNSL